MVLIQPNETVRLIMKFEDFADTTIPYMYHCHILMHEDDGMMGQFVVGNYSDGVPNVPTPADLRIYPNPVQDELNIATGITPPNATITITDIFGRELYRSPYTGQLTLNTSRWNSGIYFVQLSTDGGSEVRKVLVE